MVHLLALAQILWEKSDLQLITKNLRMPWYHPHIFLQGEYHSLRQNTMLIVFVSLSKANPGWGLNLWKGHARPKVVWKEHDEHKQPMKRI